MAQRELPVEPFKSAVEPFKSAVEPFEPFGPDIGLSVLWGAK